MISYRYRALVWVFSLFLIALSIAGIAGVANADPRIEEECHIPVNANNTDIEVKLQNCQGEIFLDRNGQAQGRFYLEKETKWPAGRLPFANVSIKGEGVPADKFKGFKTATDGATCTMVTRDYNNGQYNYTEYNTTNWALTARQKRDDGEIETTYSLRCFDGNQ